MEKDYESNLNVEDLSERYLGKEINKVFLTLREPIIETKVKNIRLEIDVKEFRIQIHVGSITTRIVILSSLLTLVPIIFLTS